MQYILSQTLQAIKFDEEIKSIIKSNDVDALLNKIKVIFEDQLDRHQELYWKKQYSNIKASHEGLIQENLELRKDLREMDEDRVNMQKEMACQAQQIEDLQGTLSEIEDKLNYMHGNVQEQRLGFEFEQNKQLELLNEKEEQVKSMEQIIKDLQNSLNLSKDQGNKECKQLKKELKQQQDVVSELRQQMQGLKKQLETQNIDKQCVEQRSKQQKNQNDTLHKQTRQLEIKLVDANEEIERLKRKLQQEQTNNKKDLQDQEKQFKKRQRKYKDQVQEIIKKLKMGFERILSNLKLELDNLKLASLKLFQFNIFQDLIKETFKNVNEWREQQESNKFDKLRGELQIHFKKQLSKKEQDLTNEIEKLITMNEGLEKEISECEHQIKSQSQELEKCQNQLIEQQCELEKGRINFQSIELSVSDLEGKLIERNRECSELQGQVRDLVIANEKLRLEIGNGMQFEFQDRQIRKQYEELSESNKYLRKQYKIIQDTIIDKDKIIQQLREQAQKYESKNLDDVEQRHKLRLQNIKKY